MLLMVPPIILALVAISAPTLTNLPASSIRDVDFRNFTFNWYPGWADTPPGGRRVKLRDGEMNTAFAYGKEPRKFFLIDEPIKYGDLTGDGREEAVVVLGIITSGTARPGALFVYTMDHGKPTRLFALETGDRWDHGYYNAYIQNSVLVVERYKPYTAVFRGEKHDMSSSSFYIRDYYEWSGARFRKTKSRTVPVDRNDSAPWAHRI
jgi:hypothetical protein